MKKVQSAVFAAFSPSFILIKGGALLLFLFGVCFAFVHLIKLALLGWKKLPSSPSSEQKEKASETPSPKPVYYIVERKKRATRAKYSKPKEIHFN